MYPQPPPDVGVRRVAWRVITQDGVFYYQASHDVPVAEKREAELRVIVPIEVLGAGKITRFDDVTDDYKEWLVEWQKERKRVLREYLKDLGQDGLL